MKKKINFKKICILVLTIYGAFLLLNSPNSSFGVKKGLSICVNSLIPALFPFMVLSNFAALSDLKDFFSKIFGAVGEKLFRCPKRYSFVLLFSLLGGYPVGAQLINNLFDSGEISVGEAERLLCFCVNCSPAFIINALGIGLLKSPKAGLIIWISEVLATLTTANFVGIKGLQKGKIPENSDSLSYISAFTESVKKSSFAMLTICGFTAVFTAMKEILGDIKAVNIFMNFIYEKFLFRFVTRNFWEKLFWGVFELNSGIFSGKTCFNLMGLFAFLTAFGGLSVFFQIRSIVNKNISLKPFVISRFFMGFYSAFLTELIKKHFFPEAAAAMTATGTRIYINPNCVIYTLCMLSMLSMIFLSETEFSKKSYKSFHMGNNR